MGLVDEKHKALVDTATNVYSIEEVRNAKAVASVVEKLYGVHYSISEVMLESQIHRESSQRDSQNFRHR